MRTRHTPPVHAPHITKQYLRLLQRSGPMAAVVVAEEVATGVAMTRGGGSLGSFLVAFSSPLWGTAQGGASVALLNF